MRRSCGAWRNGRRRPTGAGSHELGGPREKHCSQPDQRFEPSPHPFAPSFRRKNPRIAMNQSSSSTSKPSASVRSSAARRAFGLTLARAAVLLVAASTGLGACKKSDAAGTAPVGSGSAAVAGKAPVTLLNVSYDPTRELYQEF